MESVISQSALNARLKQNGRPEIEEQEARSDQYKLTKDLTAELVTRSER